MNCRGWHALVSMNTNAVKLSINHLVVLLMVCFLVMHWMINGCLKKQDT